MSAWIELRPRLRARHGLAIVCLTGALAPLACSSDPPGLPAGASGVSGGAAGSPSGGSSSTIGGVNGTAGMQGGSAGGPAAPATCTDCAEFGLQTRPANATCLAGEPPPTNYKFTRIWQGVTLGTALGVYPHPDGQTLIVAQKTGVARAVPKDRAATQAQTREFLNLTSVVNTDAESGLLSMAFHPDFASNGYVYAIYTRNDGNHSTRVSRFKSNNGGVSLDLASETKVYEHTQLRGTHHGGDMKFGADGYLYISFGDNNTGDDHQDFTAADPKELYGKVLRIDVNVPGEGYQIPADNPFADGASGAPEVWAYGFRNPWRFSFDKVTNELWLADPGEEANGNTGDDGQANPYEEVDRVVKGKNYGWPFFQGTHCFHHCTMDKGEPPELEYSHNGGPAAVIGGFVYRGTAIPGLIGKYIFGDYEMGEVWAYDPLTKTRESLGIGGNVVAFGQDNDGEIYASREGGQIEILEDSNAGEGGFPERLSQTGCVDLADPSKPASGVIPFSVALPFWSDGAEKERFLALPDGKTLEVADDGDFTLPVGGVTMKNFRHEGKLFETRFFVRHNDGTFYGYSYEWNAEGTDATLVPASGKDAQIGTLAWTYPSRTACFTCHSEAAGRSLGLETRQLNSVGSYPSTGLKANQFNTLMHIGMLSGNTALKEPFPAKDDLTAPLDVRAKAYLASNCSHCHRPNGPGRGHFNALFDTPLAGMGICNQAPEHGDLGVAGAPVLKPGDHASSVMWLRMSQRTMDFMPPIASKVPDSVGATLLAQWIDSVTACP